MQDGKLGFGLIGASTISREWMIEAMRASGCAEPVAVYSRDASASIAALYSRLMTQRPQRSFSSSEGARR